MSAFDWTIIVAPAFVRSLGIASPTDRDDAIQDACLKLLTRPLPVTPQLLRKTTLNRHKDRVKGERRRSAREKRRANGAPNEASYAPHGDAIILDPTSNLLRREKRLAIKRAIRAAQLPAKQRCALWAWMRGRLKDWALRREISPATTGVWAYRARKALRPHLVRAGLGLEAP